MKLSTYKFKDRVVKELFFSTDSLDDLKKAEKQKAKLENAGFNLFYSSGGFFSAKLGYVKKGGN